MAFIRNNIWLAFYFIVLSWTLFLGTASYVTYQSVYDEYSDDLRNISMLKATSLRASFEQYETILNIVADDLIKDEAYSNPDISADILEYAIGLDSSIVALVTYNIRGEIIARAPDFSAPKGFSLLELEESKSTFQDTLNSDGVVLGRTYFSELINTSIVPFRQSVRDENGNVLFVLALSINVEKGNDFILNDYQRIQLQNTYLYREKDRYFQLAPIEHIHNRDIYQFRAPVEFIQQNINEIKKATGSTYDEIKQSGKLVINKFNHPVRNSLAASVYLKKYGLWLTSEVKQTVIRESFLGEMTTILAAYLIPLPMIFVLFRHIAKNEDRKRNALIYQANHDYLTKLYNRYYFDQYLSKLESHSVFSLIYIDIDNFKSVNDNFGHSTGDKVLKEIASRLKEIISLSELLIRSSTDEFAIIFPGNDKEKVKKRCEAVMTSFQTPFVVNDYNVALRASMAVSFYPEDSDDFDTLKRNADLAMYESKKERNTVTFYQPDLLEEYLYKNNIENELKKALAQDEIYLVYQPQYSLQGDLKGVEALIRWENEKLGFIPPDKFIPIAESSGYMNDIGNFVISTAIREVKALQQEIGLEFDLSINVSVKQFQAPGFLETLEEHIRKNQYSTEKLLLEVTENVLIDDVEGIRSLMNSLRENDIRISLDDFGTGYSSLSLLKNLPIDELKIDRSFVSDMLSNPNAYSMVEGILTIAQKLNMETVAEGIETKEMEEALRSLNCEVYQGYYYSKPVSIQDIRQLLTS